VSGGVTLRVPQGVEIKWQVRNDPKGIIKSKQYQKGSYTIYEWSVADIAAAKWEDNGPKSAYFIPHIIFNVASWKHKGKTMSVLSNLDDLHHWYYKHLNNMDEKPSEELMNVVQHLKKPGDQEIDVVQKVFYWVQDNIRYIAFEDGMRGFIPHKPSYVFEKRYGDCKDMASLIVGMLKAAGVKSYYTWIGSRDLPYRYSEIPSPLVDNHMIATYIDAKKNYFYLDGTSNFTSVFLPSSMIQGKEAFIALDSNRYEVREVPKISADLNTNVDTVRLKISDNALIGKGKTYLTGFQKIDASYDFNKTQAVRQKENVLYWVQKGSNKFFLDAYTLQHLDAKDKPLIVDYDFRVSDYVNYVGAEIFVNLSLEKLYYNQVIPTERKTPIKNDHQFTMRNQFVLEIPSGYEIEYLPPNSTSSNSVLAFDISYKQAGTAVILNTTITNNTLLLSADQFGDWNNAVKQLSKAYKESVIFKKKSP
jgi:hypothetical protein